MAFGGHDTYPERVGFAVDSYEAETRAPHSLQATNTRRCLTSSCKRACAERRAGRDGDLGWLLGLDQASRYRA